MSGHYYSEKPSSSGKRTIIKTHQFGNLLTFKSQSGVFSWSEIDKGSEILLNHLLVPNKKPKRILDIGCGYGFLGISLAKAFPSHNITLVDINELAIKLTKENCRANNVESNTRVKKSYLYDSFKEEKYDLIVTNPPLMAGKKVLAHLIDESVNYLTKTGSIQLVVPKKKGLLSLQNMLKDTYEDVSVLGRKSGYWVLMGKIK
ncbi:MAG: class I SAM-dependent methyltransferase [Candidatus Heimdallarchaeota archaeon]